MRVIREWDLIIDANQVLRGQGADPEAIRARSPHLVELAEQAIERGSPLLDPVLMYRRLPVERVLHERIQLQEGAELRSKLLAQHLAPASEVIIILCTIGGTLEDLISETMQDDLVYALALYGLGSAGVESIANAACHEFELEANKRSLSASIPLSPGMIEWSVEEGQPQIFDLLPTEEIGVTLTPSMVMLPQKSLSMIIGVGEKMAHSGTTCDFCSMRENCRYQDHYA